MDFIAKNRAAVQPMLVNDDFYEVHIYNEEVLSKGLFEVFVGHAIAELNRQIPLELSLKVIPAGQYARVDLKGETIISDWYVDLDRDLAGRNWQRGGSFFFQVYDDRYKGLDRIAESELTAYIPVEPLQK